jgi:hypothetical protein
MTAKLHHNVCVALAPVNVSRIFTARHSAHFTLKVLTKVDGETAVVSRSEVSSLKITI